jgi:UPF0755 protein
MRTRLIIGLSILVVIVVLFLAIWQIRATNDFPVGQIYKVENGVGLNFLASDLEDKNIIRSPFLFKVFSVIFGGTKGIMAGDYLFKEKENLIIVAKRISEGDFGLIPVRITIPEGLNVSEIGKLYAQKFPQITSADFIKLASSSEGYLFPDTYVFLPNITAEDAVKKMQDTFVEKFEIVNSDVVKLASILELEARTTETRKVIAGILWKRIEIGMPLQVDASFKYVNGKNTSNLTLDDLKLDSPYNSYLYKGLPPTPISNPGQDAIEAALNPTKTAYLYFLSDSQGNMHYAKTYAEHLQNKQMYLK